MDALDLEAIAAACVAECRRQKVGLRGVADLLDAYVYATERAHRLPTLRDLEELAGRIEPKTFATMRGTPVTFADGGTAASYEVLYDVVSRMFALLDRDVDPGEFVHHLLSAHPFTDGNGRCAFVIYNWLRGTLATPEPLPHFQFA